MFEPLALGRAERCRRVTGAGVESGDVVYRKVAYLAQGPEQDGARRRLAHNPGGRGFAAQRIENEARERGAVTRSSEPMREAPVLQRIGGRTPPRFNVAEDFDRGRNTGGGDHSAGTSNGG